MARDLGFDEWRQQQLRKAPRSGGVQSPIAPNAGIMQRAGITDGHPGVPSLNAVPSKYLNDRPDQPQPSIDDVDMGANWYSPFQPVWPFGPPNIQRPREWDFPVGYNLNYIPQRMEMMSMLRGMSRTWGVLAAIIATRMDQLLRIPWTIQRRDKPRQRSVGVDEMVRFFKSPDKKLSYSQWSRKLLFDLLELDAPTVYFTKDRRGRPLTAEVLSGQTIFPLIDDAGRRPDSIVELSEDGMQYLRRQPAFQQIIKGLPMVDLDESELMYVPMRPRPELPMFGYPPTEQILVEASEAVRKTFYQLNFWAEGTIPDLIVTVPDSWSPRQIAMFQAHFDAVLSGNMALKSKVRFVPGGMKPFDIKNSSGDSLWSQRDETLIRLACYAYSVSPAPFVRMLNRATAQNAQQMAEEEGLYPLMSFWKDDIIDPIIQGRHGLEDIEFVFLPRPEPDLEKQSKIHQVQVKDGIRPINEVRDEMGLEPIKGGENALVFVGNAVIPLEMAAAGHALPALGGVGQASDGDGPSPSKDKLTRENVPQRGAARPRASSPTPTAPTPIHKIFDPEFLLKATREEVRQAAEDAKGDLEDMSHLQLHSGNYPKGHVWVQGLNISIENAKGSLRGEKDQHGVEWQVKMPTTYGYIRGTIGADGDQIDVYIGKHPENETVWVIDQNRVSKKGNVKGFDEHKVMLGYKSLKRALKDYLASHFDDHGHDRLGDVVELSVKDFKDWLKNGKHKEPLWGQGYGERVLKDGDLRKADTISTATGLNWYDQTLPVPKKRKRRSKIGPRWTMKATA